jgi:hypothetical protein
MREERNLLHKCLKKFTCVQRANVLSRLLFRSRDRVVGIATGYGLDDRGVGVRVPVG